MRGDKTKLLHVRITEPERAALEAAAKEHGQSISAFVVVALRKALGQSPGPEPAYMERLNELVYQTRKMGLNMNQIAHAANTPNRKVEVDRRALGEVRKLVDDMFDWLAYERDLNRSRYVRAQD